MTNETIINTVPLTDKAKVHLNFQEMCKKVVVYGSQLNMALFLNPEILIVGGSLGSGKTHFAAQVILDRIDRAPFIDALCTKKAFTVVVAKHVKSTSESSVFASIHKCFDLDPSIKMPSKDGASLDIEFEVENCEAGEKYTCTIKFFFISGFHNIQDKLDGINITVMWVEEGQHMDEKVLSYGISRTGRENLASHCNEEVGEELFQLKKKRAEGFELTAEEEQRIFYIEAYHYDASIFIMTCNYDLNLKSEWILNRYKKALHSSAFDFLKTSKDRQERPVELFVNVSPFVSECPFYELPNKYNMTDRYGVKLDSQLSGELREAKLYGKFVVNRESKPVYHGTFVDSYNIAEGCFDLREYLGGTLMDEKKVSNFNSMSEDERYYELCERGDDISYNGEITEEVIREFIRNDFRVAFSFGMDFGSSPALVIVASFKINGTPYIRVIFELSFGDNEWVSELDFIERVCRLADTRFFGRDVTLVGDPSGRNRNNQTGLSISDVFAEKGFSIQLEGSNNPDDRITSVQIMLCLRRMKEIEVERELPPVFAIYENCATLIEGFRGSYCYKTQQRDVVGNIISEVRDVCKNRFSHPHDALQYAILMSVSTFNYDGRECFIQRRSLSDSAYDN